MQQYNSYKDLANKEMRRVIIDRRVANNLTCDIKIEVDGY